MTARFVFATGNKIIGFSDRINSPDGDRVGDVVVSRTNRTVDNLYRWRQPGDITNVPAFTRNYTNYSRMLIDSDLEDGSYLKCSAITLGYRFPEKMLKNTFLQSLKATFVASNVFTLTKYNGTDPETQTAFGYPITRNYTISLNVGF